MSEKCDPPIVEQDYLYGVKVVDIGDVRVARGMSRRPVSACNHQRLIYDPKERRIWCKDCETDVEAFDAFQIIVGQWHGAHDELERRQRQIDEAKAANISRIAAKRMEDLWRRKNVIPACPHCHAGLLPEDAERMGAVSKEIEVARRKKKEAGRDG